MASLVEPPFAYASTEIPASPPELLLTVPVIVTKVTFIGLLPAGTAVAFEALVVPPGTPAS